MRCVLIGCSDLLILRNQHSIIKMRNLEILALFRGKLANLNKDEEVLRVCVDEFTKTLIVLTNKLTLHRFAFASKESKPSDNQADLTLQGSASLADFEPDTSKLIDLQFVQELQAAVVVFHSGSMFLYKVESNEIEEVGTITDGIIAAAWSPNQEHFAVASGAGKLMVFNSEFEPSLEANIDDGDLTFHDKKAGEARDEAINEASISWREDSLTFAINYTVNGGRKCLTRDVQKNLLVMKGPARADYQVVFSVSEKPNPALALPIRMMPNGSLITGFMRRPLPNGKISPEIVFWERNGLRHGEFTLPKAAKEEETQVHGIAFNLDSTLLAVHLTLDGSEQVMIYQRSNWKWYCKQIVSVKNLRSLLWQKKFQLLTVQADGLFEFIEFNHTNHSSNLTCNHSNLTDFAYTAVVDGPTVHLTPLAKLLMPPPMSEKQVTLPHFCQCLSLFGHWAITVSEKSIFSFECEAGQSSLQEFALPASLERVTQALNFCFNQKRYIALLSSGQSTDLLTVLEVSPSGVKIVKSHDAQGKVQRVALGAMLHHSGYSTEGAENSSYTDTVSEIGAGSVAMQLMGFDQSDEASSTSPSFVIQMADKSVHRLSIDLSSPSFNSLELFDLPFHAIKLQCALLGTKEVVVSLTANLRLYINGKLFSNEATGFMLTQNFLAFINSAQGLQHLLYTYDLSRKLPVAQALDQPPKLAQLSDSGYNVRAVERGSRIVTISGFKAVLQMPRGNLEGVQPRILLLKEVINLIEAREYGKSFRLLRQHKLDINLVYDVNPEQFEKNVPLFVREVKQVDYLNLFINSLNNDPRGQELEFMRPQREEELIEQKHRVFMEQFSPAQKQGVTKVNKICDALRAELERVNKDNCYMLPILTTYIKKDPQELKQVLSLIQRMQRQEQEQNLTARVIPPHLNPQTLKRDVDANAKLGSKEALEYVSWLVNPNRLFDVALTTFDFDLVTLVATQTQKDPKEYVPYLQELKSLPAAYMKFKVYYDLKDYHQALIELSRSDEPEHFAEAMQLVKKQRLFQHALECFKGTEREIQVKKAFAAYLEERAYCNEAGMMYLSAGFKEEASRAFSKGLNVQMFLATLEGVEDGTAKQLKSEMVDRLTTAGMNEEAGDLLDPKADFQQAVECYLRANCFEKAIKLCYRMESAKIEGQVRPALLIAIDLKRNQLQGVLDTFGKRMLRLSVLQHNKRIMPVASMGGANQNFELDSEQLSVSNASESQMSQSGRSFKSGSGFSETSKKSRRQANAKKKMKKKRNVKEGSPFEEEYLIELLQDEVKCTEQDKEAVRVIMKALVFFGMVAEANMLHGLISKLMRAEMEVSCLLSVEQEQALEQHPEFRQNLFPGHFSRQVKEEKLKKATDEWENAKSFKH